MASQRCPQCSLVNPSTAARCDCGYSFADGSMGASLGARLAKPVPNVALRTSGMAIAGFALSFFCTILGFIFSIIGYNECKNSNGTIKGEGLALAGMIISVGFMLIGLVGYVLLHHH